MIDLNALVEGLATMLRRVLGEDIEVVLSLAASPVMVDIDPASAEQVIVDLALGARTAMPRGGTLRLETDGGLDGETIRMRPGVGNVPWVTLTLTATAGGVDGTAQAPGEEPSAAAPAGGGYEIGLSTAHRIVTECGGTIRRVASSFEVRLPLARSPGGAPAPRVKAQPAAGAETILVVDDLDMLRNVTRQVLQSRGYTVLTAASSAEALETSERHEGHIDLLLTDVVMPGVGGPELVEHVLRSRPGIKVVYMSGHAPHHFLGVEALGGDGFLHKPFTAAALANKVREVLDSA